VLQPPLAAAAHDLDAVPDVDVGAASISRIR
jgi:hypothetical protein